VRFDSHGRNVIQVCNYHVRALRRVRTLLTDHVAQMVASSIVASRLDYCNALRQAVARPEQSSRGRLPTWRTRQPWSAAQVTSVIPSEVAGHVQGRTDNLQGAENSNAGVPQRPGANSRADTVTAVIRRSTDH